MLTQLTSSLAQSDKKTALIAQCAHPRAESLFAILDLLGITAQITKIASDLEVCDLLRRGLPNTVLRSLREKTGFSLKQLSIALGITEPTLQRRCAHTNRGVRLSAHQSSIVWQVATVFARAQLVLGSAASANSWLGSNAPALGDRKPIKLLALWPGVELVSNALEQINVGGGIGSDIGVVCEGFAGAVPSARTVGSVRHAVTEARDMTSLIFFCTEWSS